MTAFADDGIPLPLQPMITVWNGILAKALGRLMDELLAQLTALDGGQEEDESLWERMSPLGSQLTTDWDYELERMWKNIRLRPATRNAAMDLNADMLQLVDTAEMEEEVRVKSMALRIRHQLTELLTPWREGLLRVYGWKQWPDLPLPYDPEYLILLMRRLLVRSAPLSSAERIRWLQAFVAGVLEGLPDLLTQACDRLQEEGFGGEEILAPANAAPKTAIQLPEVLERLQTVTLVPLSGLFEAFLQALPAVFYEYIRTVDEAEQERVMALLPEIQRSSATVKQLYIGNYQQLYMTMRTSAGRSSLDALGLMDESAIQWGLKTQVVAQRNRKLQSKALQALQQRFAQVLKKVEINERNLPLDPAQLLKILDPVLAVWALTEADRQRCLDTYEKLLLSDVALVLETANQFLAEQGVLPDLPRARIIKAQETATTAKAQGVEKSVAETGKKNSSAAGASGAAAGGGMNEEELSWLRGLIRSQNGQFQSFVVGDRTIGASVQAVSINPQDIPAGAQVTTLPTRDLLAILDQLQQKTSVVSVVDDAHTLSVQEVRGSLKAELQSNNSADEVQTVRHGDEDVINLISMIFDFILDDEALPTPMKALLGRLQIPLLKVAMLDKTFFDQQEHPARSLLNLLTKAGMGWSQRAEGAEDLYSRIESIVFRIVREFNDDLSIFSELLAAFSDYFTRFSQRQDLLEKRTREAEEGKARSEVARAMTSQTINRRLQGTQVPQVLVDLIRDGWQQVLFLTCLRHGVDSDVWKQAVKVMDALIWSVLVRDEATWRQQLQSLSPKILLNVRKGLKGTSVESAQAERWLQELAAIHERQLRADPVERIHIVVSGSETAAESLAQQANGVARVTLAAVSLPEQAVEPGVDADHLTRLIATLPIGVWVERLDHQPVDRCKLVARIRIVDKLVFTNRRGIKELEVSSAQLETKVRSGQWRLLDRAEQVFDKALETVLSGLRQRKTEAA